MIFLHRLIIPILQQHVCLEYLCDNNSFHHYISQTLFLFSFLGKQHLFLPLLLLCDPNPFSLLFSPFSGLLYLKIYKSGMRVKKVGPDNDILISEGDDTKIRFSMSIYIMYNYFISLYRKKKKNPPFTYNLHPILNGAQNPIERLTKKENRRTIISNK